MGLIQYDNLVNGKKVNIIFIFDLYPERQYQKDFADFIKYQTKNSLTGELGETYFKLFGRLKSFPDIPYQKFCQDSTRLFSQSIFYLLNSNPEFIVSDRLNIQIKLIHNKDGSLSYDLDASDPENACFECGGRWFLQAVVAPYTYFNKIDFSYISRFFLHELNHFQDHMNKYLVWEERYSSKIKRFSQKKSNYSLNYLFNSLFNLREEGAADFMGRKDSPKIDINMKGIREYNQNLVKLVTITRKKEAEVFYETKIGWGNLTASGEYTAGRNMCLFIALSLAKQRKISYNLQVGKQKWSGYDFPSLNQLLSSTNSIYIIDLPTAIITEAMAIIRPKQHFEFIKLYEQACDYLTISEQNRIMTRKRASDLQIKAIAFAQAERKRRLKKYGFLDKSQ